MRVLITGGAGFIGSYLSKALIERGDTVSILDDLSSGSLLNIPPEAHFVEGSILEQDKLEDVMNDIEVVFHLAAKISVPESIKEPNETYKINLQGTQSVIHTCAEYGVKKIIFASSAAAYGNEDLPLSEDKLNLMQTSPYGKSKRLGEMLIKDCYDDYQRDGKLIETVSLRYFNVYGVGQRDSVIVNFLSALSKSKAPIIYGDGTKTRDFIHVHDIVKANLLAMDFKNTLQGDVFNVGTGKETTITDLAAIVNKIGGSVLKPEYVPVRDINDTTRSCADMTKTEKVLGFRAKIELEEGLRSLIR